jgi:hypothetical protein
MHALRRALRALEHDRTWDPAWEEVGYLEAAKALARVGGHRVMIFGHTHQAK